MNFEKIYQRFFHYYRFNEINAQTHNFFLFWNDSYLFFSFVSSMNWKLLLLIIILLLKSYSIWHRLYDDSCERVTDDYREKFSMKIKISFCMFAHVSTLRWLNLCAKSLRDEVVIIIICHCVYWVYEIALRDKLLDQLRRQRKLF